MLTGLAICFAAFACTGFRLQALNREHFEEMTYDDRQDCDSFRIDVDNDSIRFQKSEDDKIHIKYQDSNFTGHQINVDRSGEKKLLTIKSEDKRQWYDYVGININFAEKGMIIYLPEKEYISIDASTINGSIRTSNNIEIKENMTFNTVNGQINMKKAKAENIFAESVNGKIEMHHCFSDKNIIAKSTNGNVEFKDAESDCIHIETVNGGISLYDCDGNEISASTCNGNISGKIKNEMRYSCSVVNGTVTVPGPPLGYENAKGNCYLSTVNGNITME